MRIKCKECGKKLDSSLKLICPSCGRLPVEQDLWKTIEQLLPLLIDLNNKINKLKRFLKNNKIPLDDQRTRTVVSLGYITMWTIIQLKIFVPNFKTKISPIPVYMQSLNKMSEKDMIDFIFNFDLMNRISFFTMFLFQTDVFLRSINSTLRNKSTGKGYKTLVKHVLKELKIPNQNNKKYHILYIPAIVRNCLHTDGIHTEEDDNGKIEGILFKFKKGCAPGYGSWLHEYFFCDKILDVIEEILNLPKIKMKKLPIFKGSK